MRVLLPVLCMCWGLAHPAIAREVKLDFLQTLETPEAEVPYRLSMTLRDLAPTRIGVDALLDLRDVQAALSDRLSDSELAQTCNAQATLDTLKAVANGDDVAVRGEFTMETFKCDRKSGQPPKRLDRIAGNTVTFSAAAAARVTDQCVYFELSGLELSLSNPLPTTEAQEAFLKDARAIFLKVTNALLKRTPICPQLPDELASIDPRYSSGGTVEIGDHGVGVALVGSFDVSPETILDILRVLQEAGKLPPAR